MLYINKLNAVLYINQLRRDFGTTSQRIEKNAKRLRDEHEKLIKQHNGTN